MANLTPANITVSNTAITNFLTMGSGSAIQPARALFYDSNGDGNSFAIQASSGDSNIHLVEQGGSTGASVYVQGNMNWIFTTPAPLFGNGVIAQNYQTNGTAPPARRPRTATTRRPARWLGCYSSFFGRADEQDDAGDGVERELPAVGFERGRDTGRNLFDQRRAVVCNRAGSEHELHDRVD